MINDKELISGYCKWLLNNKDIVALDTETTGTEKDDEIIELAFIHPDITFNSTFKPQKQIDPQASEVNGFTNEMLKNANKWTDYEKGIGIILRETTIIGWNIDYDKRLIKQTCDRYDWDSSWIDTIKFVNIQELIQRYYQLPHSAIKQNDVQMLFGLNSEKHKALDDIEDMLKIVKIIAEGKLLDGKDIPMNFDELYKKIVIMND